MSRDKSADPLPQRGKPIKLPDWWLADARAACAGVTQAEICRRIAKATKGTAPSSQPAVADFLSGKVTTDVMVEAFLSVFPLLERPVFVAASAAEAALFRQIVALRAEVPRLTQTSEDYDADKEEKIEPGKIEPGKVDELSAKRRKRLRPPRRPR